MLSSATIPGEKISIKTDENFPYKLENNAITIKKGAADRLHLKIENDTCYVSGTLAAGNNDLTIGAVANDNIGYLSAVIQKSQAVQGMQPAKGIRVASIAPEDAEILKSKRVKLTSVAQVALVKPDNFITDFLLAHIASKYNKDEWRKAGAMLKTLANKYYNTNLKGAHINDGSGLSKSNLLTPNQFSDMLKNIAKDKDFSTIQALMALPGEGALKGCFSNTKIYAKIGTLQGVSTIIGYFYNKRGHLHSFVIMSNNFRTSGAKYKKLEEDILSEFY